MVNRSNIHGWALYPWFEEHGSDYVHPEDLNRFRRLIPYGRVFAVVGEDAGFAVILFGEECYRVKPQLLSPVPPPAFSFGERVRVRDRDSYGDILEIWWHHNGNRPFFHLRIDGKRSKRRFWAEELVISD